MADKCYSSKFGFIALFPTKHEKLEVEHPTGTMANFTAVLEEERIVLRVNAQKGIVFKDLQASAPSEETIKKLLTINFKSYAEASALTEIQSEWVEDTAFPVMKNSFAEPDFFGEGVKSYESGYWMLVGDTIYRIIVKGLDKKALEPHLLRLYAGFMIADANKIKELENELRDSKVTE